MTESVKQTAAARREYRILSPTAILGYGFPAASFARGLAAEPDLIAVDAGSTDPGPYYLGAGVSFTDRSAVKRDLTYMLTAGVRRGIPVVIGTAGGSGAAPHLAWCRAIVEEIAREQALSFKLGVIACDLTPEYILPALREGRISPLPCVPAATEAAITESTQIVAQIGVEPIIAALDAGCDVVLAGRAYDPACFAAAPIRAGYDPGLAIHLGKILECAAIAAEPGSGADCVLGVLREDAFSLRTLSPERRFTYRSACAHTLYEKSDPCHLPGPGGALDLEGTEFTEDGEGVTVRGSRFVPADPYTLKIEGARPAGFRTISLAGVRDPILIGQIDAVLAETRRRVAEILPEAYARGRIHLHLYGKDGVMGPLEPHPVAEGHELAILIAATAPSQADADSLCSLMRSTLLHQGYPGRIATAGNLAFPFSPSDLKMGPVYEFSLYHLLRIAPREATTLFPVQEVTL